MYRSAGRPDEHVPGLTIRVHRCGGRLKTPRNCSDVTVLCYIVGLGPKLKYWDLMEKISVLFVCLGNICRSPTAHGVFQHLVEREGLGDRIQVDSAGTHAYHVNDPPDPRAQAAAARRGVDLSILRARKALQEDFEVFDYVLAMDRSNFEHLSSLCPPGAEDKLRLFLSFAPELQEDEVPDPYYGGTAGFERVLDMIERASEGLLADIRQRHQL